MKVLIIRFSSIGDIVLTTPVVRCLKLQIPTIQIHYATKINFKSILETNPYVDKIHFLNKNISTLISELKAEKFDYIIDLHNNIRTLKIKWSLGVKSTSFNKLNIEKWLLVNLKINKLPNIHIVDRYLETTKHLGITNDNKGLDYFIPESDVVNMSDYQIQKPFICFAIGGQHETKKLPLNKIVEICNQQTLPVVLLGGKEDIENGEEVIRNATNYVVNLSGKLTLNQSASVANQAYFVITHDTGMMHIAAALKKTIFAIWGNTVPAFGMYPYQTNFINVENQGLSCRPCSKIGYSKCPKNHFKCMVDLNVKEII